MENKPIQWHPGFESAVQVELQEDREFLQFEKELNLTKKPLQIDVLIRKKEGYQVRKSIGRIFRMYNIVEYKSPEDSVSINSFYKAVAYACLYQSDTERVAEISPSELTISLVCSHYPRELVRHLVEEQNAEVERMFPGIYYVRNLLFPVQIVLIHQLSSEEYVWLSRLRGGLKLKEDIEPLARAYQNKEHNPLYQAVMDLIVRANKEKYEEGRNVCDALMELFADKLEERRQDGRQDGSLQRLVGQVRKKIAKGLSAELTADCLEETVPVIQRIYEAIQQNPEADDLEICELLKTVISAKQTTGMV